MVKVELHQNSHRKSLRKFGQVYNLHQQRPRTSPKMPIDIPNTSRKRAGTALYLLQNEAISTRRLFGSCGVLQEDSYVIIRSDLSIQEDVVRKHLLKQ